MMSSRADSNRYEEDTTRTTFSGGKSVKQSFEMANLKAPPYSVIEISRPTFVSPVRSLPSPALCFAFGSTSATFAAKSDLGQQMGQHNSRRQPQTARGRETEKSVLEPNQRPAANG